MIGIHDKLEDIRDAVVNEELEQAVALLDELIEIIGGTDDVIDRDARDAIAKELGEQAGVLEEDGL